MGLLYRQLYDIESGTFTYLLADAASRAGIIIDAVYERHERDLALIGELEIDLQYAVETHADHVTAAWAAPTKQILSASWKTCSYHIPKKSISRYRQI